MAFLRHAAVVAWKDLRIELRSREIVFTMGFFAAMLVLVCSFAFVSKVPSIGDLSSGVLWISVAFAGTLGLSRAFERERDHGTMRALLLSPASRSAIFLGKAVGVAVSMLIVELVVVPLCGLLFGANIGAAPHLTILLLVLVTIGYSVVGSTFAGMLLRTRARQVLLAVILYPILTPAIIAGVKGTAAIWSDPPSVREALFWCKFLAVFDLIFVIVSLWAFESLVIE
jgi:heme exporter protein B